VPRARSAGTSCSRRPARARPVETVGQHTDATGSCCAQRRPGTHLIGALDRRTVGLRVRERHAELDDVGAAALEGEQDGDGVILGRVAGSDEGDEDGLVLEQRSVSRGKRRAAPAHAPAWPSRRRWPGWPRSCWACAMERRCQMASGEAMRCEVCVVVCWPRVRGGADAGGRWWWVEQEGASAAPAGHFRVAAASSRRPRRRSRRRPARWGLRRGWKRRAAVALPCLVRVRPRSSPPPQ
jgi:hypothetical protein